MIIGLVTQFDSFTKDIQMEVTYEHRPALTFIGFSTAICPEEGYQKCPEFWDREYARKYARLPARAEHPGLAGMAPQ